MRGLSSLPEGLEVTGRDRDGGGVMSGSMKVRYIQSQEHRPEHLAQSFSAWDLYNLGGSADIFSRVTSSLRIELLCSYFDGNLNTVFLTLIKTAIIHNRKTFL